MQALLAEIARGERDWADVLLLIATLLAVVGGAIKLQEHDHGTVLGLVALGLVAVALMLL